MQKNTMLFLAFASILLGVLWYSGFDFGSFSSTGGLISQSAIMVNNPNGGSGYWWITTGYATSGEPLSGNLTSVQYNLKPQTIQEEDTTITPTKGAMILWNKSPLSCKLSKTVRAEEYTSTSAQIVSALGLADIYMVGTPQRSMPVEFSVYKTATSGNTFIATKSIDLAKVSGNSWSTEVYSGEGILKINVQGLTQGTYDCAEPNNLRILSKGGTLYLVDKDVLVSKLNTLVLCGTDPASWYLNANCQNAKNWFNNPPPPTGYYGTYISNTADGYVLQRINEAGVGLFTIQANAEFFEAGILTVPKEGKPVIQPLPDCSGLPENGMSSITFKVKNEGAESPITVSPAMSTATFIPPYKQLTVKEGETKDFTFSISVGDIRSDLETEEKALSVEACSGDTCTTKTSTCEIINEDDVPKEVCGNGICEGLETLTCTQDCVVAPPPLTCTKEFMFSDDDGVCRCIDGYTPVISGNEYVCEKETEDNTLLYVAGGVVALVIIVGGAMYLTSPKGKRRRK